MGKWDCDISKRKLLGVNDETLHGHSKGVDIKPREFWIGIDESDNYFMSAWSESEIKVGDLCYDGYESSSFQAEKVHHLIEYSEYERLKKQNASFVKIIKEQAEELDGTEDIRNASLEDLRS